MLKVTTRVEFNHLPRIAAEMGPKVGRVVNETLLVIERSAKEEMRGAKSGRLYERAGGKMHQASAPGEAPAVDFGALINSIQSRMEGMTAGMVFTNMDYGPVLEFGSIRMAARPFMMPAAVNAWPGFVEGITQALEKNT